MNTWYSNHLCLNCKNLKKKARTNLYGLSLKIVLLFLVFNSSVNNVFAVTKTWSGGAGSWNTGANWSGGTVPAAGDDVVINATAGTIVAINVSPPSLLSITVNSGNLQLENGGVRVLAVTGNISIATGASFTIATSGTSRIHTLALGGNLTNNGTLNFRPSSSYVCNVTFNKNGNQTFSGSGTTNTFSTIIVNLGGSNANILEMQTIFTMNAFTLTSGTFKLSALGSLTLVTGSITIGATAGLWINGTTVTGGTSGGDITLSGILRVSSGSFTYGGTSDSYGDDLRYNTNSSFIMEGGTFSVAGTFSPSSTGSSTITYNQSGGTVTVANGTGDDGDFSSSRAPFDISQTGSSFTMSGGIIVVVRANPEYNSFEYINLSSTNNVTGGTLQIGASNSPSGQLIDINTNVPVYNLNVNATTNTKTARLLSNPLTVKNDVTINTNSTLNCNSLSLNIGGNFSNSGIFTAPATTTFNSTSSLKTIAGNLTGTSKFSGVVFNGVGGQWSFSNPAEASTSFTITNGTVTAPSGNLTVTGSFTNSGSFIHNNGTVIFNGTSAQTISGNNPTAFNNFTLSNANGVTLSSSVNATVNGTLTFTNGVLSTNANKIILASTGSVNRTLGHVRGNFQKNIGTGSSIIRNFEIGSNTTAAYTPASLTFTNVSVSGDVTASTTTGDHDLTGSSFTALKTVNRYWTLIPDGSLAFDTYDATFTYLTSDKDPGINSLLLYCGKYDSGVWTYPSLGARGVNYAIITGVTNFSDFQLGNCESAVINPPVVVNDLCYAPGVGSVEITTTGGTQPLTYSWLPGGETTPSITGLLAGNYTVTVTSLGGCTSTASGTVVTESIDDGNACTTDACNSLNGEITHTENPIEDDSNPCTLDGCNTLSGPTHTPTTYISGQPVSVTVCENSNTSFTVSAEGPAVTYQWQDNSSGTMADIASETNPTLNLNGVTLAMSGRQYQCLLFSPCGNFTTDIVTLTVDPTTLIGSVTSDATVCSGINNGILLLGGFNGSILRWESSLDGTVWSLISNTTSSQGYLNINQTTLYRAVTKSGTCIEENSLPATITVNQSLAISGQPQSTTVCENSQAVFSITASGDGLAYQWQDNSSGSMADISGEEGSTLTLNSVVLAMSGRQYQCVLTGICGTLTSSVVTLTVSPTTVGGSVSGSTTICSGINSGSVTLSGHTGNVIRWESSADFGSSWSTVANTTTSLNYSNLNDTIWYRAIVKSGACQEDPSVHAEIIVNQSIAITTQPVNTIGCIGGDVTFFVEATGTNLNYQWQDNSSGSLVNISGETASTLLLSGLGIDLSGRQYRCIISGACPTMTSSTVTLTVRSNPTATANVSANSICSGSSVNLSSAGAATEFNTLKTLNSGTLNLAIPNNNVNGVSSTLSVSGSSSFDGTGY